MNNESQKVKTRDGDSGSSSGPKGGALDVSADDIVSGSDGNTIKDGRGMKTVPSTRDTVSGSDGNTVKDGRGMVGNG